MEGREGLSSFTPSSTGREERRGEEERYEDIEGKVNAIYRIGHVTRNFQTNLN